MKITTEYIHEKGSGWINEDTLSLNRTLFGVFDGATSLERTTFDNNITGGYYASSIASDIFTRNNDSLANLARRANGAIFEKMVEKGVNTSDKSSLWSTSAAVLKIEKDLINWVQTGDSLLLMIYEDGSYKIPATGYDQDRETLLMWREVAHKTDKKISEVLGDQIRKIRAEMNVTYGVLNGERTYIDFLNSGTEPLEGVNHILLFTDGLLIPSQAPETEPDFNTFVDIFLKKGLTSLKEHVRSLEASDPDCRQYPRFKCHDDIAAVAISF